MKFHLKLICYFKSLLGHTKLLSSSNSFSSKMTSSDVSSNDIVKVLLDDIIKKISDLSEKRMSICEQFTKDHNLQFSTNTDIKKSKTKCVAFLTKNRVLKPIKLNGTNLPWIDTANTVNTMNYCKSSILQILRPKIR